MEFNKIKFDLEPLGESNEIGKLQALIDIAELRQTSLFDQVQDPLRLTYGLRNWKTEPSLGVGTSLEFHSSFTPKYARMSIDCCYLSQRIIDSVHGKKKSKFGTCHYVCESEYILVQLKMLLGKEYEALLSSEPKVNQITLSICIITFDLNPNFLSKDKKASDEILLWMMKALGARPPTRNLLNYLTSVDLKNLPQRSLVKKVVIQSYPGNESKLPGVQILDKFHHLYTLSCALSKLTQGLDKQLPKHTNSPDLIDAIQRLKNYILLVNNSIDRTSQYLLFYNYIIEEISLCLDIVQPYKLNEVEEVIENTLFRKVPTLKAKSELSQAFYIGSSGMEAIAVALESSLAIFPNSGIELYKDKEGVDLNYFELKYIIKAGDTQRKQENILVATLNTSVPVEQFNSDAFTDYIIGRCNGEDKMCLILNITLETQDNEVNDIIVRLWTQITTGKLNIFLCKSLQKYITLGSGKASAGLVVQINSGNNLFEPGTRKLTERKLNRSLYEHADLQFLIHCLTYTSNFEVSLTKQSAELAKFINDFCWQPKSQNDCFVRGLPFLLRKNDQVCLDILMSTGVVYEEGYGSPLDSFSCFSWDDLGNCLRLNPGLNTQSRAVELYFGIGHLNLLAATSTSDKISVNSGYVELLASITSTNSSLPKEFINNYQANAKASLLLTQFLLEYRNNNEVPQVGVIHKIEYWIKEDFQVPSSCANKLSYEMKSALVLAWCRYLIKNLRIDRLEILSKYFNLLSIKNRIDIITYGLPEKKFIIPENIAETISRWNNTPQGNMINREIKSKYELAVSILLQGVQGEDIIRLVEKLYQEHQGGKAIFITELLMSTKLEFVHHNGLLEKNIAKPKLIKKSYVKKLRRILSRASF